MMNHYSKSFLVQLYKTMVRIRLCEESLVAPILEGKIRCPVHLYSGQEAIATGICAALAEEDYVFGSHRSHGHYLAKGGEMRRLIAEIYGKETGCSRGRGGSMHIIDPERGVIGAVPIVAGTISLALGAGLASKMRGEKRVSVSFFGDGAATEGVLYESLNFAALKKLPVLFVCENNAYSTHMPIGECRPDPAVFKVGKPYGIFTIRVNGNDVLRNYERAQEAVDRCRRGDGPAFMECVTYRLRGHVGPDDNIQGCHTDIRPPEEIRKWERKDPLKVFKRHLIRENILGSEELRKIDEEARNEVKEAHAFSQQSPFPRESELGNYVFSDAKTAV
jgi:pyruvate dehydrogenase E1 component alpha subunit